MELGELSGPEVKKVKFDMFRIERTENIIFTTVFTKCFARRVFCDE
jgi:hypothetical protein